MNTATFGRLRCALLAAFAFTALALSFPATASANQGGTPANLDKNSPFTAIYVLGDSLSDTGRTSAAITSTTGVTFPPSPYAPGRFSNGALWIEYFASMVRRNYDPNTNLAWAGATTGLTNVEQSFLPGMKYEVDEAVSPSIGVDRKALYIVFGGSNDSLQIFPPFNVAPSAVILAGVQNLLGIVNTLHAFGAENIVVVDMPDIGQTPRARTNNKSAEATQFSIMFNTQLNAALDTLSFPICRVSMFNLSRDFAAQPKKYGFTDVTSMSYPDLKKAESSVFWDDIHPTTRAHYYIADEIYHAITKAGMNGQQPK